MIELKDVTKIYRSKRSSDTLSLDNISLNIASKGITFIVGPSGSGKSTLLNIIGGLDSLSSGSIKIDGKNITSISGEQIDSYLNTYVGFIFQDYNLIGHYNVYDNVKIALSLQEKDNDERITKILDDLGLKDLEKRNINELSGGQKQRVAIARALVKDPKLILADEPTGNLDSKTSIQIMEILKRISDDRQVIVVSHDLKLAEKYGDRIIEIEDGKITSDTLRQVINEDNESIIYKKSKLPLKEVLRLGLANIRIKLFRFVLVTILVAFALLFVAFAFNMLVFNPHSLFVDIMKDQDEHYFNIVKKECGNLSDGDYVCDTKYMSEDDINTLDDNLNMNVNPIYIFYNQGEPINFIYGDHEETNHTFEQYYLTSFTPVVELENKELIGNIKGRLPEKANELVISFAKAETFMRYGVKTSDGTFYKPNSVNELIVSNKKILFGENEVIIVGVTMNNYELYNSLKIYGTYDSKEIEQYINSYGLPNEYIYAKGFKDIVIHNSNKNDIYDKLYISNNDYFLSIFDLKPVAGSIRYVNDTGIVEVNDLKQDEVILSLSKFKSFVGDFDEKLNTFRKKNMYLNYEEALEKFIVDYINKNTFFKELYFDITLLEGNYSFKDSSNKPKIKLVGISMDDTNYVSSNIVDYFNREDSLITGVRLYNDDFSIIKRWINKYNINGITDYIGTEMLTDMRFVSNVSNVKELYDNIFNYIIAITIIFTLFAAILFYNFLKNTIIDSKKYIGILRALGTSEADIIKIFFIETILISVVSWILSIFGWYGLCNLFNVYLNLGSSILRINYIISEPMIIIVILVFVLLLTNSILMTLIRRISKIRPIDTILNKK